jgi:hypothetical protein
MDLAPRHRTHTPAWEFEFSTLADASSVEWGSEWGAEWELNFIALPARNRKQNSSSKLIRSHGRSTAQSSKSLLSRMAVQETWVWRRCGGPSGPAANSGYYCADGRHKSSHAQMSGACERLG